MGSGGGSYFPPSSKKLQELVQASKQEANMQRTASAVNRLLRDVLANQTRDPEKTQQYLNGIQKALEPDTEMVEFLFGGSVAKHTYADGLSDIDSLVILDRHDYSQQRPAVVLDAFLKILQSNLKKGNIKSIAKGNLAVTVRYKDDTEIQLLPALREGKTVLVGDSSGKKWRVTDPRKFQKLLSSANSRLDGQLVPVIKLFKSINAGLAKQKQLSGYHIEALALDAVKGYRRRGGIRELLLHVLQSSSARVIEPIRDITGQSRNVDDDLGPAHSNKRRTVSDALGGVARRLANAKTAEIWQKALFD